MLALPTGVPKHTIAGINQNHQALTAPMLNVRREILANLKTKTPALLIEESILLTEETARMLIEKESARWRTYCSMVYQTVLPGVRFTQETIGPEKSRLTPDGFISIHLGSISNEPELVNAYLDGLRAWFLNIQGRWYFKRLVPEDVAPLFFHHSVHTLREMEAVQTALAENDFDLLLPNEQMLGYLTRFLFIEGASRDDRVLELGSGLGSFTLVLTALGYRNITALDINLAQKKLGILFFETWVARWVEYYVNWFPSLQAFESLLLRRLTADMRRLPLADTSFAKIFTRQTISMDAPFVRPDIFREAFRVLESGGHFVLAEYDARALPQEIDPDGVWHWSGEQWVTELVQAGFQITSEFVLGEVIFIHAQKPCVETAA